MEHNAYVCIDLKSFFASVECVDRGLDPFETNLVVADAARGSGAITLAITPAMKKLGVKNRCRIFEIPPHMQYITAKPRMKRYMEMSAHIYGIYLRYISPRDIHVYSIDECFIDVAPYLHTYGKTPKEMAIMLMDAVMADTGICATAGVGTNMFLAKVALDITAKHAPDNIGVLDQESFKEQLWHHRPITDIWNIGRGTAKRLAKYGVYDLHGVTLMSEKLLYREFGKNARYLIDHAHGIEPCTIADIQSYQKKSASLSHGQILFEDYNFEDALLIVKEMVDVLCLEMVQKKLVCGSIALSVNYSKEIKPPTGASRKIGEYTNSYKSLSGYFEKLYRETARKDTPIRKVNVCVGDVVDDSNTTVNLFINNDDIMRERKLQQTVLEIKDKYGKNSILKGMNYFERSTARARNKMVGGHNGE